MHSPHAQNCSVASARSNAADTWHALPLPSHTDADPGQNLQPAPPSRQVQADSAPPPRQKDMGALDSNAATTASCYQVLWCTGAQAAEGKRSTRPQRLPRGGEHT